MRIGSTSWNSAASRSRAERARTRVAKRRRPGGNALRRPQSFRALSLVGPDARSFLQGYLTCDMAALTESRALQGAYCNIKGRVVADATVRAHQRTSDIADARVAARTSGREPAQISRFLAFAIRRSPRRHQSCSASSNPPPSAGLPTEPLAVAQFARRSCDRDAGTDAARDAVLACRAGTGGLARIRRRNRLSRTRTSGICSTFAQASHTSRRRHRVTSCRRCSTTTSRLQSVSRRAAISVRRSLPARNTSGARNAICNDSTGVAQIRRRSAQRCTTPMTIAPERWSRSRRVAPDRGEALAVLNEGTAATLHADGVSFAPQ